MSGPVAVRVDFPGAALDVRRVDGATVYARLREEAVCHADGASHDYSRHFAFGVENRSDGRVDATVLINCTDEAALPDEPALLCTSPSPEREFTSAALRSRSDANKAYAIHVVLAPRETIYVANYLFRPYAFLTDLFDRLGARGGAIREVLGHSVEGRDLVLYNYTSPADGGRPRPAVLISSGVHPPEPDTLATEAIMEHLATPDGERLRETFDFHLLPIGNPDGFVHGYSGCNANEINYYWLFDRHDRERRPEAYWLWQAMARFTPVLYFDWHGYTFQRGAKHAAPYVKPVIFHAGAPVRRLVSRMNERMVRVAGGHVTTGFVTFAPSTLARQATETFNTITYAKYHLELRLGVEANKRLAVASLREALATLVDEGFLDPRAILKAPYGGVAPDTTATLGGSLVTFWAGKARPVAGRVRRSVMKTLGRAQ